MNAHTPGPWRWFGNLWAKEFYLATETGGRVFVMTFERFGMQGAQPCFQVKTPTGGLMTPAAKLSVKVAEYRGEVALINHPDARLIAAAPELLKALIEGRCSGCGIRHDGPASGCPDCKAARAAIAKATTEPLTTTDHEDFTGNQP